MDRRTFVVAIAGLGAGCTTSGLAGDTPTDLEENDTLPATDTRTSSPTERPSRSMGEWFKAPRGTTIRITKAGTTNEIVYEDSLGGETKRADENRQFLYLHVEQENRGDQPAQTAYRGSFQCRAEGNGLTTEAPLLTMAGRVDATLKSPVNGETAPHQKLNPGESAPGWILFETYDEYSLGQITVRWFLGFYEPIPTYSVNNTPEQREDYVDFEL